MKPLEFHDVEQNQDEWYQLRSGKLTMSKLGIVMASAKGFSVVKLSKDEYGVLNMMNSTVYKKKYKTKEDAEKFVKEKLKGYKPGEFTQAAIQYAVNIAIEQITGEPIPSSYTNPHMERGHEQEPIARALYEQETFQTVESGGFFCSDQIGYSPDGLVKNGLIEIKSVIAPVHYNTVKRGGIDPAYKWQIFGGLKYSGLDFIDFVSYCSDFPEGKQLYIRRVHLIDGHEEIKQIDERVEQFLELVKTTKDNILNAKYL